MKRAADDVGDTATSASPRKRALSVGAGMDAIGSSPLLTDLYQLTMSYAYWKAGRQDEHAVFDLFFRKNPFRGEYTVFAGLDAALSFIENFKFTAADIAFVRSTMPPDTDPQYLDWLASLDMTGVKIYACMEGTFCFPRIPVMRIEGPLGVGQLLETTLLNLLNYASLMATNATRFRAAAGEDKKLLEFGLRRAQGPNGALSASKYAFIGGFDGTSNVLAGKLFDIPVRGTHAHSFVQAYSGLEQLQKRTLDGKDFVSMVLSFRDRLGFTTNDGELAAFIAYTLAFPSSLLALIDTYDVLGSGLPNFICVALALHDLGRKAIGIRLDSGDLAYLSREVRKEFQRVANLFGKEHSYFAKLMIVASNDINEEVLHALRDQGHEIDSFGIGTHLVTCQAQPALGMVYKLVEVNGRPRIKLSQDVRKVTIPGNKRPFRLIGASGVPLLDLMIRSDEEEPVPGQRTVCRHPFDEKKRAYVTPSVVQPLHKLYWDGSAGGRTQPKKSVHEVRAHVTAQRNLIREDTLRPVNPTPYKVSVSDKLYNFLHDLWLKEVPIPELS